MSGETPSHFASEYAKKKRWIWLLIVLSAVVAFVTVYFLVVPAITMQQTLVCTIPEHTHTDACYEDVTVPEETSLICPCPTHEHSAECYDADGNIICGLEEHVHDSSCFETVSEHTEKILICGLEEHTHTDACYASSTLDDEGYFCGKPAHKHSDACYDAAGNLTCGIEEHEHDVLCTSNPAADVETASVWEKTFADAELGDNWRENMIAIANTQIGYTESTENFIKDEDSDGYKGYTRYGDWYGDTYGHWCAMFASFCMNYAGVDSELIPFEASCERWVEKLQEKELYHPTETYENGVVVTSTYMPQPGDLIFFDYDEYDLSKTPVRSTDHVGIVSEVTENPETGLVKIKTIEGNRSGAVGEYEYYLNDSSIAGFAEIPDNPEAKEYKTIYSDKASDGAQAEITGNLPKGATATIEVVEMSQEELKEKFGEEKASLVESYVAYDIKILVDGEEWQPDESVSVVIRRPGITVSNGNGVGVAHLGEKTEIIGGVKTSNGNNADNNTDNEENTITFEATGFSPYVIYTYSLNGCSYSIEINESTYLSDLFEQLQIDRDVSDVTDVQFSNDTLLRIIKTDDDSDWIIYPVICFDTPEILSVYFSDGEVCEISVTVPGGDSVVSVSPKFAGSGLLGATSLTAITPSGAQEGTNDYSEKAKVHYLSDASTSNIETEFTQKSGESVVTTDNGKVVVDKSVIYGKDDYNAFTTYSANTFGVTLSALGQEYNIKEELKVTAPMDVVLVLDGSKSMVTGNEPYNATKMVEAVNRVMTSVLQKNEENRVGVVAFSNSGRVLLPLGRYYVGSKEIGTGEHWKFFEEKSYTGSESLTPVSGIKNWDGTDVKNKGTFSKDDWMYTYTQLGLSLGTSLLTKVDAGDISVEMEVKEGEYAGTKYTVKRQPVLILLSDGEPTLCTTDYQYNENDYVKSSTVCGSGTYMKVDNNKGVLGYYTILTAVSCREAIANKYGTAHMYSIGIGINATGYDSYASQSVSGDHYKRAVLDPSSTRVADLDNNSGKAGSTDISQYSAETNQQLKKLLTTNDLVDQSISVKSSNITIQDKSVTTKSSVKVIANPYTASQYSYADQAYFGGNTSAEELTKQFESALQDVYNSVNVYGLLFKPDEDLVVSDTIGDGMVIKGDPKLYYNGTVYDYSSKSGDSVVTYTYMKKSSDPAGEKYITAVVNTTDNTVTLHVPQQKMPAYKPVVGADGSTITGYTAEYPVRLIYQVGLNDVSENAITTNKGTGKSLTYYANKYSATETNAVKSEYYPTSYNSYYDDANPQYVTNLALNKTAAGHVTGTQTYSRSLTARTSTDYPVSVLLGNNGKLEVSSYVDVTIKKVKTDGTTPITDSQATFKVYSTDPEQPSPTLFITVTTDETGTALIEGLENDKDYWIVEEKAPGGYIALGETIKIHVTEGSGGAESTISVVKGVKRGDVDYVTSSGRDLVIKNDAGEKLPETGGPGSALIIAVGIAIVLIAVIIFFARKKRSNG